MIWPFRRRNTAPDLDPALRRQAAAGLPWLRTLDPARDQRLQALVAAFLAGKAITPLRGLRLNDVQRLRLAMLCCLPLLEFGREGLHGWRELLVYPDAFRVQRSHQDAHGVLHEWDDDLIGEAWEHGPVILSWADVRADIAAPRDGFCVVAHEIAHKLDALDGAMDGTPPLPRDWQLQWASDFQRAYDALCARVDAGDDSPIDDYATESPEEFFAVCTEYHFSDPARLRDAMPEVAAHLQRFYGAPLLA
ncbi:zinc-dependent peptidase [Thermomonas sp.]|uniref:M90 family metallopeptidase n=1 Tax=Thermomonas sp. TaxID=1971895 RepID=UPI0035AECE77